MDNNFIIDEILKLYFQGYSYHKALEMTKTIRHEYELSKVLKKREGRLA